MLAKDSNELLDYALRELQIAVKKDRPKVEIFLEERCVKYPLIWILTLRKKK